MKSWLRISYGWVFGGGRNMLKKMIKEDSKGGVLALKNNLYFTKFKYYPEHWATKDAINILDRRLAELDQ